MNAKRRLVMRYFLRVLQLRMQRDKNQSHIDPVFLRIFNKNDLKKIVRWMSDKTIPSDIVLERMPKEDVLNIIQDEQHILSYLIKELDDEVLQSDTLSYNRVRSTLDQIGLHSHYLISKEIVKWNSYDHANFRSLCRRAGKQLPLYGIYDKAVEPEDKYLFIPAQLYESKSKAQAALEGFASSKGYPQDGDLKIMIL